MVFCCLVEFIDHKTDHVAGFVILKSLAIIKTEPPPHDTRIVSSERLSSLNIGIDL